MVNTPRKNGSQLITVFGGQFGSEGKGEIAALISDLYTLSAAVRIGGPNAGHTCYDRQGNKIVVQSLPTPSARNGVDAWIGPEGCIIPELLAQEVDAFLQRNPSDSLNLFIDECCAVITPEHMQQEVGLKTSIGSTGEGVGAITADKIMRKPVTMRDYSFDKLGHLLATGRQEQLVNLFSYQTKYQGLNKNLKYNSYKDFSPANILIEGTQGFGLSLHTSGYYPFCTSRECTPQALWAGTGINPKNADIEQTVMVVRTYPIRVSGFSGPLANEITWEELNMLSNGYVTTPERTTVTKKIRRIAKIDQEMVHNAALQCGPTCMALTFLDYKFPEFAGFTYAQISAGFKNKQSAEALDYIASLEDIAGVPIWYISTGAGKASITSRHPLYNQSKE